MLKNTELTYVSLFSAAGIGCYGFKKESFHCIATNELISKRMDIQKANNICEYNTGYIVGDVSELKIKNKIYSEIKKWSKKGNDRVDVVIATPPCQGISVINHKKNDSEITRNSLVVDSVEVVMEIKPRFFIFENVMAFQKTICTAPDKRNIPIGDYIKEALGKDYIISGRILNLMNYGSNSSRTRTIMIGVDRRYRNSIAPYDLYPEYSKEKSLRDVIYNFRSLEWGEIDNNDFYHAFRVYDPKMRSWIHDLKEGESAFDNPDPEKRPSRIVDGKRVENVRKNRDKYTRQPWDRFIQCVHTRNDQLAAQNTIHPEQDRVYSIRELMKMMSIPTSFKWIDMELNKLDKLSAQDKISIYKSNELNIRRCIGEAVPTESVRKIARNIKTYLLNKRLVSLDTNTIISDFNLLDNKQLKEFIKDNPLNIEVAGLMRIAELCNAKREEHAAFYTNKFLVNEIMGRLPDFGKEEIYIIEPSVGSGNFIPFLIKRYEKYRHVYLDLVDIDKDSIELLKLILKRINIPDNFTIAVYCEDFLMMETPRRYDLAIGNPPFSKLKGSKKEKSKYFKNNINKDTNNLSELFLEKCMRISDCVSLVLNKTILSAHEFETTRNILRKVKMDTVVDFGRHGFTGVSIETMCLIVYPRRKPTITFVYSMKRNITLKQQQNYITDDKFPYFLIYRDSDFDLVADKLKFGVFDVYRDRQITKSITTNKPAKENIWVVKAKNINNDGSGVSNIKGYDKFLSIQKAQTLGVFKYVNNMEVYLTPNMTYNPRVIKNIPHTIPDGSTAVLIPKNKFKLSAKQRAYFSTDEYRRFYSIARNLSTQSINVDKTSVFFYGILGG